MRTIFRTKEFNDFLSVADENVKAKVVYLSDVVINQNVINTKIAKKLINTNFYELRIQIENEYRIILFAIDHENINQCKQVLFLNGFLKKSTKDYVKQIKKAVKILELWKE